MRIDTAKVRELAALLDHTGLTEIEVRDGDRLIRVARAPAPVQQAAPAYAPAPAPPPSDAPAQTAALAPAANEAPDVRNHPGLVRSPMVGTAYLSPEPGGTPFVTVGAQVAAGEILLIIEAMKVMNPINAPRAGRVTSLLVQSEQPVEYDQPLVVIE